MGSHIGVYSEQIENNDECHQFINKKFYDFVISGEMYGEKSILKATGTYYGLDLSPLLKLVYQGKETNSSYIAENTQNTESLLSLISIFKDKIQKDQYVCNKIDYVWYYSANYLIADIPKLIEDVGSELAEKQIKLVRQIEEKN